MHAGPGQARMRWRPRQTMTGEPSSSLRTCTHRSMTRLTSTGWPEPLCRVGGLSEGLRYGPPPLDRCSAGGRGSTRNDQGSSSAPRRTDIVMGTGEDAVRIHIHLRRGLFQGDALLFCLCAAPLSSMLRKRPVSKATTSPGQ